LDRKAGASLLFGTFSAVADMPGWVHGSHLPLSCFSVISKAAQQAHDRAEAAGEDSYIDPDTGYQVLTAQYLKNRNSCCDSGCRHCPYTSKAD